jgi:hypothetical protein
MDKYCVPRVQAGTLLLAFPWFFVKPEDNTLCDLVSIMRDGGSLQ